MITLNYTLTQHDYARFYHQVAWLSSSNRKITIKKWIYSFLIYSGILLFIKVTTQPVVWDIYFFYSIFVIALIFIFPIFRMEEGYRKQVERLTKNPLNVNFFSDMQISIAETGILIKGKISESKYQWASIVKKEEDKDYYFLYLSSEQVILLPKRAFKSEVEKQAVEKLFAENISFNAEVGHLVKD